MEPKRNAENAYYFLHFIIKNVYYYVSSFGAKKKAQNAYTFPHSSSKFYINLFSPFDNKNAQNAYSPKYKELELSRVVKIAPPINNQ